jgi:hypothetical protein
MTLKPNPQAVIIFAHTKFYTAVNNQPAVKKQTYITDL